MANRAIRSVVRGAGRLGIPGALGLLLVACGGGPPSEGEPEAWTSPVLGVTFRHIPAGEFRMGSPSGEMGRDEDETLRQVRISRDFWLAETEVTQEQWRRLMGTSPSFLGACGESCPVESVSWFDAIALAEAASKAEGLTGCYELIGCSGDPGAGCPDGEDWCHGEFVCEEVRFHGLDCQGYRLPTEAEWEYAARAGTTTATWIGDVDIAGLNSAPDLSPIAWYAGNSGVEYRPAWPCAEWRDRELPASECGAHPVGQKPANPWGLHDMLGNVWEWTWDWQAVPGEEPTTDPLGPAEGEWKIRRGCSWSNIPVHCRAADRSNDPPGDRDRNWGLRLARTVR